MKIYLILIMLILARSISAQGLENDISDKPVVDSMHLAINAISLKSIDEISNNYKRITNTIQERSQQLLKKLTKEGSKYSE